MQMTNIDQNDQKLAPRSLHRHTRLNRWSPPPTSPSWSIIKTFLAKLWSVSPLSEHRPWLKRSCYHRPQGRLHFHDHNSGFIFSSATIVVTRGKKDKDQRWNKRGKGNFLLLFLLLLLLLLHSHQIQSVKSQWWWQFWWHFYFVTYNTLIPNYKRLCKVWRWVAPDSVRFLGSFFVIMMYRRG